MFVFLRRHWSWILPVGILVVMAWFIQFSQPLIIGADGFLHGRMAIMMSEQGFLTRLPQAYFSWFNSARFSDKDFLYHLYLVPFVKIFGYIGGTKLGAFFGSAFLYVTVFWSVRLLSKSQWAGMSALLLLFSGQFLRDTAEARPLVFAMALTVLGISAIAQRSVKWVFLLSLLYGMAHLSGWLLPIVAVGVFFWEWGSGQRANARLLWASFGGYALSFLLHPNFPNNIFYFYLNGILVPWYAAKTGVLELGAEFFPLYTHEVLRNFPGLIGGLALLGFFAILRPPHLKREIAVWTIACILFGVLGLVSKRNMTHLYPIFVTWFGIVMGSVADGWREVGPGIRGRILLLGSVASFFFVGIGAWMTTPVLHMSLLGDRIYAEHFVRVGEFINAKIPKGNRIFHTNWSDSQFLIGVAPTYEYIETLDPIYMYNFNPKLYELYRSVSFAGQADIYTVLKESFGASYGYAGKNYFTAFIEHIRKDDRFTILGEDQMGVIFSLK